MGRSSVSGRTVTVFGGSGHVGRHLVNRLGQTGTQVVVPYRGDEYDVLSLRVMGDLGRIHLNRFHLRDYPSIRDTVRSSDVVVNLIGQDRRTFNFTMEQVNVEGAGIIARACREVSVPRLIHTSALRARAGALSEYSRTKAAGELEVVREFPEATIIRPATLFGTLDRLFNGIGQFTGIKLGFPLVGAGDQVKRPLHVANLADAIMVLIRSERPVEGRIYELVGPRAYTYRRLVDLFAHAAMCSNKTISLPPILFWAYGRLFPEIRRAPFPYDTILQLAESERELTPGALRMEDLGFSRLETVEEHLLAMARRYRRTEDFGLPIVLPPELMVAEEGLAADEGGRSQQANNNSSRHRLAN